MIRIKREKDLINRLLDILDYKKITYQNKLDELDRKREIERILSKYPGEPFKGLIELETEQIITLFSYFTEDEYNREDLDIKKYWMSEACSNEALKDTARYKEACLLFERLSDKLQEYLETLKGIDIDEAETINILDLATSLSELLRSRQPIDDLSIYYPILSISETLTEDDIYNFLIALSLNNIVNLNINPPTKKGKLKLTNEMRIYLKDMLESRIAEKEEEKRKNVIVNDKLVELSKLIEKVKTDNDAIIDFYPTEIQEIMTGIWPDDFINKTLDQLMIPITVIKGKKQGLAIDFNGEDLAIISSFVKDLVKEETKISEQDINNQRKREEEIVSEINTLTLTLDKLLHNSKEYFVVDDFYNLVELLKINNKDFDFIKNVIVILNALNFKVGNSGTYNTEDENEEEIVFVDEEPAEEKVVVEEVNNSGQLEKLFFDNGLNYSSFPSKLVTKLEKEVDYNRIKEIVEYIDRTEELSFLKQYTYNLGNSELDNDIHEIKCSQIYFILAYSTIEILDSLIYVAKENNLDLVDIFAIPKVFASVSSEAEGTYENFMDNIKLIRNEYPNMLNRLVKRSPYVLGVSHELFRKNIELTEKYEMSIETDKRGGFPSPRALVARDFEYTMDRYIEAGEYDYIERFRSQLETNSNVALRIKYLQLKGIDFRQGGFVEIEKQFSDDIKSKLVDATIENIPVGINDELIKRLDLINEESDETKSKVQYILNNIYISRIKTLKNYSTLLINGCLDKENALLYSMCKDSYLTFDEFNSLKSIVLNKEGM